MPFLSPQRGFTLFIAVLLLSVILSVGLALLDLSYKQLLLSSAYKNSTLAFYNADAGIECTLYWDSLDTFDYYSEPTSGTLTKGCQGQDIYYTAPTVSGSNPRITTFVIPCGDGITGDGVATSSIYKYSNGKTSIYVSGYDTCQMSDPQRTERGLKASS